MSYRYFKRAHLRGDGSYLITYYRADSYNYVEYYAPYSEKGWNRSSLTVKNLYGKEISEATFMVYRTMCELVS